jgi:hypothetical protein
MSEDMNVMCRHCRKPITNKQYGWVHKETGEESCIGLNKKADPQMFCKGCNEPKCDKDICDCGYGYEIRG